MGGVGEDFKKQLNTILSDCLHAAEKRFGKRDLTYLFPEIVFDINGPHSRISEGNKLIIQLPVYLINNHDLNQAVFQQAHEVIHCLSPIHTTYVTYLEEGLATLFSKEFCIVSGYGNFEVPPGKYKIAFDLVEQLLKYDQEFFKKIRQNYPVISMITVENILHLNNSIPIELAQKLTRKFYNSN